MIKIDIARKPITFSNCDERYEIFAPSWSLLMSYKNKEISWDEYVIKYTQEMRIAYKKDPKPFIDMSKRLNEVDFICWCNNKKIQDKKCHRFILREILEKIHAKIQPR